MTIVFESAETMYDAVYHLVRSGLTFRAEHKTLTIYLLGGY